ncbi:MAG: low molecular weight phosphotyrosine protein phosphatase [Bdellovibrionales bacterium]|nr:low molecular weight phosphotyrosine protein phosphatase [Bdellovibrionales bacterium]
MKPIKVLFVCLGNICRSPTAEAVFSDYAKNSKLNLQVDSAGTGAYHIGDPPDPRSIACASLRGYKMSHLKARQIQVEDFYEFDHILAMDESNLANILDIKPINSEAKIELFLNYSSKKLKDLSVPDPYWSGEDGFNTVLDLIEDASKNLIKYYQDRNL